MTKNGKKTMERTFEKTLSYINSYADAWRKADNLNNEIHSPHELDQLLDTQRRFPSTGLSDVGWYVEVEPNPTALTSSIVNFRQKKQAPKAAKFSLDNPVAGVIVSLKENDGMTQSEIATSLKLSDTLIHKWKTDFTQPNKYAWWLLGMYIGVPQRNLKAFLSMAGASCNPLCRQDTILWSLQDFPNRFELLPELLKAHDCDKLKELNKPLNAMLKHLQLIPADDAAAA